MAKRVCSAGGDDWPWIDRETGSNLSACMIQWGKDGICVGNVEYRELEVFFKADLSRDRRIDSNVCVHSNRRKNNLIFGGINIKIY